MEIAYNCGARVTLEGPAAFDVDSPNSGILHLGKATVRTPKAADRPLFCVLSPTALVTERGDCEFGLMVHESRASRVCVFRGNVEYRPPEHWGETKILLLESRDWLLASATPRGAIGSISSRKGNCRKSSWINGSRDSRLSLTRRRGNGPCAEAVPQLVTFLPVFSGGSNEHRVSNLLEVLNP